MFCLYILQGIINSHVQNAGRNVDGNGHSDEVSDVNEDHVTGQGKKGDLCCKVANVLAELCLCSCVLWKVELESGTIRI